MSDKQLSITEFQALIGTELGVSRWYCMDQDRIDAFARTTEDFQFIHLDAERASAETPFGGTIAHGFLTLSMLSAMAKEVWPTLADTAMFVNYGLNKLRFLAPVASGANIRGRISLENVTKRRDLQYLLQTKVVVEIENTRAPALVAEQLSLVVLNKE